MKKSLAMLFAMFILGACSVINSDWADLVGGKTVYVNGNSWGTFSSDAETFTFGDVKYEVDESTANSATYVYPVNGVSANFKFSDVTTSGGTFKITMGSEEGTYSFTWSAN